MSRAELNFFRLSQMVSEISCRATACAHKSVYNHYFFCIKRVSGDKWAQRTSDVLKQGHCDKVKIHYERLKDSETIMETDSKGMWDDWGDWKQWARCSYQGQPHRSEQQPQTWYYMVEVISADEMDRKRRSNQQLIQGKNGRFRHMSGARQTRDVHLHTHIHTKDKNNTNGRTLWYTICQSKQSILATLSQCWHNPKSTWLKLDLSNSAQIVSITSESFSPDWWRSATLVIVTASLWQVCPLVHIAIHSLADIHTVTSEISFEFSCKQWMFVLILVLN